MASNDVCEMRLVMAAALTARRETSISFRVRDIRSCRAAVMEVLDGPGSIADFLRCQVGPLPGDR